MPACRARKTVYDFDDSVYVYCDEDKGHQGMHHDKLNGVWFQDGEHVLVPAEPVPPVMFQSRHADVPEFLAVA